MTYDEKDHRDIDQPAQQQDQQPGIEAEMKPRPQYIDPAYRGSQKLQGQVAIITGGDSGIGRAVAVHYAVEGASVVIGYLEEEQDAQKTRELVEQAGGKALLFKGDIGDEQVSEALVKAAIDRFGRLDIIVNNAAEQHLQTSIEDISREQLERTFSSNIYAMFFLVKHALPFLKKGAHIINSASVTAYKGSPALLDYSATKGAIVAFTRSLSQQLVEKGIYVNAVAPGPVWTPLIPASFPAEKVEKFGEDVPLKRPGQPSEIAPAYVFLASNDSSYMTGQVIHPNGGSIVNG